jgi:hypothetical protein
MQVVALQFFELYHMKIKGVLTVLVCEAKSAFPQCPHVTKNKKIIFEKYTPLGVLK